LHFETGLKHGEYWEQLGNKNIFFEKIYGEKFDSYSQEPDYKVEVSSIYQGKIYHFEGGKLQVESNDKKQKDKTEINEVLKHKFISTEERKRKIIEEKIIRSTKPMEDS